MEERAKSLGLWGASDSRFRQLSERFHAEANRRGLSRRELLRALEDIRQGR